MAADIVQGPIGSEQLHHGAALMSDHEVTSIMIANAEHAWLRLEEAKARGHAAKSPALGTPYTSTCMHACMHANMCVHVR